MIKVSNKNSGSPISVYAYWKLADMTYLDCNQAFATLIGYSSPVDIIGKKDQALINDNNKNLFLKITNDDHQIIQDGLTLSQNFALDHGKNFFCKKIPIFDENRKIVGMSSVTQDHLSQSVEQGSCFGMGEYLDDIIGCMPNNVYWLDRNCVLMGGNDNLANIFGFKSRAQLVGVNYQQMSELAKWNEGQGEVFRQAELEVMRTGIPRINQEEPPIELNGEMHYYMSSKVPLKNKHNEVVGVVGISTDITELKRSQEREKIALAEATEAKALAQAQEEIQKAILTFTGTMSHDLRTPLSTIQLIISVLDKSLPTLLAVYNQAKEVNEDIPYLNDQRIALLEDSCRNIMNATKQADSYIDATLKIIKGVVTGSELLKPEDLVLCSMEEIIRRVLRNYPFKEGESDKLHSDTLQSFMFSGNSIFMARILQNLIKNAFEQILLKGKGEIFIRCEEGSSFNLLKIKDTAGGVSPPVIEKLFEGLHSSKKGGTGLGLSSAKLIMQAFGGDISCELVEGDCIEFVLSFPKA